MTRRGTIRMGGRYPRRDESQPVSPCRPGRCLGIEPTNGSPRPTPTRYVVRSGARREHLVDRSDGPRFDQRVTRPPFPSPLDPVPRPERMPDMPVAALGAVERVSRRGVRPLMLIVPDPPRRVLRGRFRVPPLPRRRADRFHRPTVSVAGSVRCPAVTPGPVQEPATTHDSIGRVRAPSTTSRLPCPR